MPNWIIEPAGSLDTARRALCEASARPALFMDFGDSIAEGYNAQVSRRNFGWMGLTRAAVKEQFGDGGEGFYSITSAPHVSANFGSPPWDLTEGGTAAPPWWFHFSNLSHAGATATVAPGSWIEWPSVRGSEIYLWFSPAFNGSDALIEIDGVRQATVRTALGGQVANAPFRSQPIRVADGYHRVRVTCGPTGAGMTWQGIEARTSSGVRWSSMSHFGWVTSNVSVPAYTGAAGADTIGEHTIRRFNDVLDLFVYELGGNDAMLGIPPATAAAQMTIALQKARAVNPACSILVIFPNLGNGVTLTPAVWNPMVAALKVVAAAFNACVIDHWLRPDMVTQTPLTPINWTAMGDGGDSIHPGTSGHAWMAEPAIDLLCACNPC